MYKYQNTSDQDLELIGLGKVKAGQTFETSKPIENPNLKSLNDEAAPVTAQAPVEVSTNTNNEETK